MIKHIKTQSTKTQIIKQKLYRMSMFMALLCCATSLAAINEENANSPETQQTNIQHVPLELAAARSRIAALQEQNDMLQLTMGTYKAEAARLNAFILHLQEHNGVLREINKDTSKKYDECVKKSKQFAEKREVYITQQAEKHETMMKQLADKLAAERARLYTTQQSLYTTGQSLSRATGLLDRAEQELRPYRALKSCIRFPLSLLSKISTKDMRPTIHEYNDID